MWNNLSDELKGILAVVGAGTLIVLTLILTNFAFNVTAVCKGLHQQSDVHRDGGFIWVK